ncbi:MAG: hypothetical protein PHN51_11910 [Candidatus Nanopelagicales bacterium]|nr:hypothetical protein [Candidatus Nanopelagicales bacterium]
MTSRKNIMAKRLTYKYHQDGEIPLPGTSDIFVFGSNLRGAHGRGAALVANDLYGAIYGVPRGYMNRCYAIPTKDRFMRSLSVFEIKQEVDRFIAFTLAHPEMTFWVTRVGCGLAGYKNHMVAPLFRGCGKNCNFPHQWKPFTR